MRLSLINKRPAFALGIKRNNKNLSFSSVCVPTKSLTYYSTASLNPEARMNLLNNCNRLEKQNNAFLGNMLFYIDFIAQFSKNLYCPRPDVLI